MITQRRVFQAKIGQAGQVVENSNLSSRNMAVHQAEFTRIS